MYLLFLYFNKSYNLISLRHKRIKFNDVRKLQLEIPNINVFIIANKYMIVIKFKMINKKSEKREKFFALIAVSIPVICRAVVPSLRGSVQRIFYRPIHLSRCITRP